MQRVRRSLPRIVCGEVMVAEPRAPELVRIWATPKNRYKNILFLLWRWGTVGFIYVWKINTHQKIFRVHDNDFFLTFEFPYYINFQ